MNKGRLIAALVANAGAIVGVYLVFWLTGPRANRVTLIGVGVLGIVILNAALADYGTEQTEKLYSRTNGPTLALF